VLNYAEEDARGVFQSGNAVFMRNWNYAYALVTGDDSPIKDGVDVTTLPAGDSGEGASILGGSHLAVSRYSEHQDAAIELVRFLNNEESQRARAIEASRPPTRSALYEDEEIGPWGKINTPIRGPENQKRLWNGLRKGTLDYVGTDTNPYELWHKGPTDRSVWEAPPGDQNGIEYNLAVMMSEGVNGNRLPVERVVEVCSTNPAKLFGLYPRKGTIEVGTDADMVVVDLDATTTIDDDFYHTMEPRWSSYHGKTVSGLPTHTIVDGELAVERGDLLVEKGGGRYLGRDVDGPPRRP
jgi:hypothetical protein